VKSHPERKENREKDKFKEKNSMSDKAKERLSLYSSKFAPVKERI
jgi:hypothetical protein